MRSKRRKKKSAALLRRVDKWMQKIGDRDYRELLQGSGLSALLRLISFLLLNLLSFYIAREYGAEQLGIYTLSFSILSISLVIVQAGTDTAVIRLIAEYTAISGGDAATKVLNRVLTFVLPFSLLISVILYLLADWLSQKVFTGNLPAGAIKIVALILPFFVLSRMYSAGFRALKHVVRSILFEIIWIRFGFLVLMAFAVIVLGKRDGIVVGSLAVIVVVNGVWSFFAWRRKMRKGVPDSEKEGEAKQPLKMANLKQIMRLSTPMYLTSSMYLLMDWTDTLMIGIFGTAEDVGVYNLVSKLSVLTSFATESINTIIVPKFSELFWRGNQRDLQKMIRFSTQLAFWTSVPIIAVIAVFSPYFLSMFGKKFATGSMALILLCGGQFVNSVTGSVIQLLNMTGHQKKSRNILLLSTISNVVLNTLLIPIFGMEGAAIATAISIAVRDLVASYWAYQIFRFPTWYLPFTWRSRQEETAV